MLRRCQKPDVVFKSDMHRRIEVVNWLIIGQLVDNKSDLVDNRIDDGATLIQ